MNAAVIAPAKRPHDELLEGLRGVAAVLVALSHVFTNNFLSPDLTLPPWLRTIGGGQPGVLIFFVLSGYVIGWTNQQPHSPAAVRNYAWRRVVRLVPIYYVALALTIAVIAVTGQREATGDYVATSFWLQNFNSYFGLNLAPLRTNSPLWSLNYEILYYAGFVLLWRFKPAVFWVFGPALLATILGWFAPRIMPLFISSYACGWLFWAAGWWLCHQPPAANAGGARPPVVSWLLLIFASHQINGVIRLLNVLGWYSDDSGMVNLGNLSLLPATLLVLAAVTHRRLPGEKWVIALAWGVCVIPLAGMIWTGRLWTQAAWVTGLIAVVVAGGLITCRTTRWLRPFAWFGGISYAFYVVHFPLLFLVRLLPVSATSPGGFIARLACWTALSVALAWLLERRFQPWAKQRLGRLRESAT